MSLLFLQLLLCANNKFLVTSTLVIDTQNFQPENFPIYGICYNIIAPPSTLNSGLQGFIRSRVKIICSDLFPA